VVTVEASTISLKVAVIAVFTATPMALLDGLVDVTVGFLLKLLSMLSVLLPPPHETNNTLTTNTATMRQQFWVNFILVMAAWLHKIFAFVRAFPGYDLAPVIRTS
jgi:hypothetical protein